MSIKDVEGVSLSPHNDHFFVLHLLDSVSIIAHLHACLCIMNGTLDFKNIRLHLVTRPTPKEILYWRTLMS